MPDLVFKALVGRNLNLTQLRGYARLDELAAVSLADEFDQELNPLGTQRDLNGLHARKIAEYAQKVTSDGANPGAFPEVILNIRKPEVVSTIKRSGEDIDFEDLQSGDLVELVLDGNEVARLTNRFDPAVSRLDGNHRLAAAELADEPVDWPVIPFAIFVGLQKDEERSLFADINANQRKMNTSHLSNIAAILGGDSLLLDQKTMPLWFANKLCDEGFVFSDRVYFGGSKEGVKERLGFVPPLTLKQLESAMKKMLDELGAFLHDVITLQDRAGDSEQAAEELVKQANDVATALNRYWVAVSKAYPDAWAENAGKKGHILFESIGLTSFATFGGILTIELMPIGLTQENFDLQLKKLAAGFSLEKKGFEGLAGGAGATKTLKMLLAAREDETSTAKWAFNNL